MLVFDVYRSGEALDEIELAGAYLFGQDSIPIRADLAAGEGQIQCLKRVPGAAGLSLVWDLGDGGRLMLPTTRLPERNEPYNLNVELARAQVMRLTQKIEDWGLFDFPDAGELLEEFVRTRRLFVDALLTDDQAEASRRADEALRQGIRLGERLSLFHAEVLLTRRLGLGAAQRPAFGCTVDLFSVSRGYQTLLRESFDFLSLPVPWQHTEPKERMYNYTQADNWLSWAAQARKPVHAGPLLSFEPAQLPHWLYLWEHDYETLRDLIYEHIGHLVRRYDKRVKVWNVVSGVHAFNNFNLTFEQIMELTRMSCLLVKKLSPKSQVLIELVLPWGEYYARNQRTIPPLLYADMAVQSGIKFDGFGVQVYMGVPADGYYVRDLLQISSMLDELVALGKSVRVTACQVPSENQPDPWDAWEGKADPQKAGQWQGPWSQQLQAQWLDAFYRVAMSKPLVESVAWRDLADYEGHHMPHGGLCRSNLEQKPSYVELGNLRSRLAKPVAPSREERA